MAKGLGWSSGESVLEYLSQILNDVRIIREIQGVHNGRNRVKQLQAALQSYTYVFIMFFFPPDCMGLHTNVTLQLIC